MNEERPEHRITGLPVSGGIAIGPAYVVEAGEIRVFETHLDARTLDDEIRRFHGAIERARGQLEALREKADLLPDHAAEDLNLLLDAHLGLMTGSRLVGGVEAAIRESAINAESAVNRQIAALAESFAAMDDPYLAGRGEDIRAVGTRLVRNLIDKPSDGFERIPEGSIVIAEEIGPADLAQIDADRITGLAASRGGIEGHTAIMARSLGIPAVLGAAGLITDIFTDQTIIIDGTVGQIIINPSAETITSCRRKAQALVDDDRRLAELTHLPARTLDGVDIALEANVDLPRDAPLAFALGADGVGLTRTEYLAMGRPVLPGEDEQVRALTGIIAAMKGKPVTVRTFDFGDDKDVWPAARPSEDVRNPALGLRAIRHSLREPNVMQAQLRAILRAASEGPVRILIPMVTSTDQILAVRKALQDAAQSLRAEGLPIANPMPTIGAMIEVPAAALIADRLAEVCDFLSIGTNDLAMYTLAVDRGDAAVADLYQPSHPAVLTLVHRTVEAARRARVPLCVCGEMAADSRLLPFLVGIGVEAVSLSPARLLRAKQRIRSIDAGSAANLAARLLAAGSAEEVQDILETCEQDERRVCDGPAQDQPALASGSY
ncbi:MAG: phosphoenolpyruvate--protein phosphotransferase [Pseudomonadota bacterium]